mgnify:CR=1 FL=1
MNDVVDVALRTATDNHHKITVGHIEELDLPTAFQRSEHTRDDLDSDRRAVLGHELGEVQVDYFAPLGIASHTVERIDQQCLLITFGALVLHSFSSLRASAEHISAASPLLWRKSLDS